MAGKKADGKSTTKTLFYPPLVMEKLTITINGTKYFKIPKEIVRAGFEEELAAIRGDETGVFNVVFSKENNKGVPSVTIRIKKYALEAEMA